MGATQQATVGKGCPEADIPAVERVRCSRAATQRSTLRDPMFWLLFCTLLATSGAAFFTGQQWITADQTMRIGNRAYVYSTGFRASGGFRPDALPSGG
jgi:hypothetical protein